MRTINYITYDSWWDTDKTILPLLAEEYIMNVIVISPSKDKKYENKKHYGNGYFTEIVQKFRDRDIRSILIAFKALLAIKKNANRSKDLFWFIPGSNPFFQILMYWYLPKERTIISYHDYTPHFFGNSLSNTVESLYARLKYEFCKKYKRFLFYSEIQQRNFEKDFKSKETAICNMPLKDFGMYERKEHDEINYLFFGAIQEYKRIDLFVEAALRFDSSKCRFVIAGKPTYDCSTIIERANSSNNITCDIRFIKDEEVLGYFEDANFLVLPYIDATQSGPMLIALNYGIPVIASDILVFKSFVTDGENGFIFESGNVDSLSEAIRKSSTMSENEYKLMVNSQKRKRCEYEVTTDPISAIKKLIRN